MIDPQLIRAKLGAVMTLGGYHRRDDDPSGIYRDGVLIFRVEPHHPTPETERAAEGMAGVLVHVLNDPGVGAPWPNVTP